MPHVVPPQLDLQFVAEWLRHVLVWGGPTVIELDGSVRIFKADRTAMFCDGAQALGLANAMSKRAWTNVTYFPGSYADLAAALHQN
jgi:hypothetical protein